MMYAGDLETTTDPEDCRVWAWGLTEIDTTCNFHYGKNLDELMKFLSVESSTVYFHNLKFDGEFILHWLFCNGYKFVKVIKNLPEDTDHEVGSLKEKQFTTLISDKGQWYSIKVCTKKRKRKSKFVTFLDSLKVLPFSVEKVASAFKLDMKKGSIDYDKYRPVGYEMDSNEFNYLKNDCTIIAKALNILHEQGLTKMTTGSNALNNFKEGFNVRRFEKIFPALDEVTDKDIRYAYRGGFTYLNPQHAKKVVGAGIVLDVNSLYPDVMRNNPMPYGFPIFFNGKYETDDFYPLYVQMFTCIFDLKPNHIPTIQLKLKDNPVLGGVDYITSSNNTEVTMCLTNIDLQLFFDHYNVYNIDYHSGWKFKSASGMFTDYIDYWSNKKISAKIEKNGGLYTLSKLMLNSLYGKFSTSLICQSKEPQMIDEIITFTPGELEHRPGVYLPVGAFITSYARNKTIRAAQCVYHRFIYADTDSLYLTGLDLPENLEIDPEKLGAWKHELTFSKAKFLRPKTNIKIGKEPGSNDPETLMITAAGLPHHCHDQVTFKNFNLGQVYKGKLKPKHVKGGVILEEIEFTLSERFQYFNH